MTTIVAATVAGLGFLESVTGTDPAANVEINEAVPAVRRWRVQAIMFRLVTDGTAANRTVTVIFKDSAGVEITRMIAGNNQIASETIDYFCMALLNKPADVTGTGGRLYLDLPPDLWLDDGWTVETVTANLQTTDNFGAPTLIVESFEN